MKYIIAVDLEGAHGIVGEPYKGLLVELADYKKAVENVTKEVNAAIQALYDSGATEVDVWDNHGNLDNLDFSKVDARAKKIKPKSNGRGRLDFLAEKEYQGILFIGYHSREGTRNGVLAHTYSSNDIQYYKLNGKAIGEFDFDSILAAAFKVPTVFLSSDDVCVKQFQENHSQAVTAITKIGKGRNQAEFLPVLEVLENIYNGVCEAVKKKITVEKPTFPYTIEVRYTRTEYAESVYKKLCAEGLLVEYGEDAHVLTASVSDINELRMFL